MQPLPKLIESLDVECRERSSTVRLVGCGARHTVAVLGNGDLFIWGRPDFGRLGRSKNDSSNEPVLVDALWRREVAEGGADRTRALGKVILFGETHTDIVFTAFLTISDGNSRASRAAVERS